MCEKIQRKHISITESGHSSVEVIWWCSDDSPVTEFAVDELCGYIQKISTATISTTQVEVQTTAETIDSAIAIVPTDTAAELRSVSDQTIAFPDNWIAVADLAVANKKLDSFAIQTLQDVLILTGSTHRGTLYAVYEFLETVGVRFYAPTFDFYEGNAEYVPTEDSLTTPPLTIVEEPSLAYRRKDLAEARSHTGQTIRAMIDWMAKTRHNVLATPANFTNLGSGVVTWDSWREAVIPDLEKRDIILETGGHGFDAFLPPNEYEPSHPEWFVDGYNVFDITNEKAVQTYIDNTVDYLEAHPEIDVFDAWPPDGADWPPRISEEFGSVANGYAYLINELTRAVRERLPDRKLDIESIAYWSHLETPESEYMYDDTILDFALFDRSYAEPIFDSDSGSNREYVESLHEWREAFDGTLSVYEYYRKYSWHSLPIVLSDLIGREIPFYDSIGVDGLWIYSEPADWIPYELTHLLVGKLLWNTDLETESYVETYVQERYGPAADEMEEYLDRVERAGRTLFTEWDGNYDDREVVSEALTEFQQARERLSDARDTVTDESTAAFLLDRLETNAEFAIEDTKISHHRLLEHEDAAREAKERSRQLIEQHYFDGIVMKSEWTLDRCMPEDEVPDAPQLIQEYQREWGI